MHLSKELQRRLDKLESNVKLASTNDGIFPDRYSFCDKSGRNFRAELASTNEFFSIVLYEKTGKYSYENCFGRGLFNDLGRIAIVIDLWMDKQIDISKIKNTFDELELFSDFESENSNYDIGEAWRKVINMFFNNVEFWREQEWNKRYLEMLMEAKRHTAFENYFPFTTHYWLRFSIDKEITETWILNTYIVPTIYSSEGPLRPGKFYVSYNDKPMGGKLFETVKDALDFYAEILKETKPIKWVRKK